MEQLSGMDATFLNMETARAPLHISSLSIYDQSSAPGGLVTFKGILANVERRLPLARCFRQRVVFPPLGLDHPYWIEDPDFDLEFHVRHIALPKPGDWRQLCIQVARIHARPLDLAKPLWEMYVIEGLDEVEDLPPGSFAIMSKIHHAAIDGVSGMEIVSAIHDLEPDAEPPRVEDRWVAEAEPSFLEMAVRTSINSIRQPVRFARVLGEVAPPALRALWERREVEEDDEEETRRAKVPRTRFNGRVSPHRVFDAKTFSLADVKQIRKAVQGATVNDVVLATCGGALRRYLDHHHELPRESLAAFAPISVRSEDQAGTAGNQVSGMLASMHTDEGEPIERLRKVHHSTIESKEMTRAIGARSMTDVTHFMPGMLAGISGRLVARTGLMSRMNPIAHAVVSNVPGPQVPLYFTGARMVAGFGMGLPLDGMGLFHAVMSYNGSITISVTSCRTLLPDPAFYAECLEESFRELREAAVT
ncbi:MAG: wax ester/triacylglycerol synthase family O-acyltransferase [Deltaproteobacteria bacterium]|jgi:WS/DGAT/MGAT family acyltransferase|nr:wax ester/triacylglycerol synthase family O-acyltransferase [Deltaproteobacteria bacterium]MBW2500708.1 wax ester/triacylglycerol synthase family O-acyltransferase [Deltaproteobacteria bacterium]